MAAVWFIAILAGAVLPSPARAATFLVSQEQILVGTTDGTGGVQSEDGILEALREVDTAPDPVAYPGSQNLTSGALVSGGFPGDIQGVDGVYVQYRETTPGSVAVQSAPALAEAGCTWTDCGNGTVSDDNYASSTVDGDATVYRNFGFAIPASSVITTVEVGYEAFDATGNDRLALTISWDNGTTWCPTSATAALANSDPNAFAFVSFTTCAGHAWAPADFGVNLSVRFTHTVVGPADMLDLDANVVRVVYQPLTYELILQYSWTAIQSGERSDLVVTGRGSDEDVSIQVLTPPSTWATRLTLIGPPDQTLRYALTPNEVNLGNVSVRFVDGLGADPDPSDLWIDAVDVVTVVTTFRLDVVHTIEGLSGDRPTLAIRGNISAGGENFDVFVWDFTARAWTMKLNSVFTTLAETHAVALLPSEVENGSVRIDYRDRDPGSTVAAALSLDAVHVDTTDPSFGGWSLVLAGGALVGAFMAAFAGLMFIRRRRKGSSPQPAEEDVEHRSVVPRILGGSGTDSPPRTLGVEELQPGRPYLIEEDESEDTLRVLEALTRMGRSGLLITHRSPVDVIRRFRLLHTKVVWMGKARDPEAPDRGVDLEAILARIDDFFTTNPVGAVLIDGMKELRDGNRFPSVLDFVKRAKDLLLLGEQVLLISVAPGAIRGRELRLLSQELEVIRVLPPQDPGASKEIIPAVR